MVPGPGLASLRRGSLAGPSRVEGDGMIFLWKTLFCSHLGAVRVRREGRRSRQKTRGAMG